MEITYIGHSCFKIKGKDLSLVIDPYDAKIGYKLPKMDADVVLCSHNHFDHSNASAISGSRFLIDSLGEYEISGVFINGLATFHDNTDGSKRGKNIIYSMGGEKEFYPTANFKLKGIHNIENIMASIAAAKACGVSREAILKTIEEFKGLPHRMELIRELNGVSYYNDSKGTNIGALQKSLEGLSSPVILIAGGKDKGGDYTALNDLIKSKIKLLILLGEAKDKIRDAFKGFTGIAMVESLKQAVCTAYNRAENGDVVLLSPACSSFDMFKDYKERGEIFRRLVERLKD